jgi:hypothetical protein
MSLHTPQQVDEYFAGISLAVTGADAPDAKFAAYMGHVRTAVKENGLGKIAVVDRLQRIAEAAGISRARGDDWVGIQISSVFPQTNGGAHAYNGHGPPLVPAPDGGRTTAPPKATVLPPGLTLKIDDWLKRDLPEPDCLVGNWLTTTSRAILNAATGLGKTNFSMAMAGHLSAGVDFLHWRVPRPRRVLFVDGEMSTTLLKQRVLDVVRRLGPSAFPTGLHLLSREDVPNFQPLNTPAGQKFIEEVIAGLGGVDLVMFDNIMSLISGDMKDEETWQQTLPLVSRLTAARIGQFWVHHTGHDASRGYGTKTREWQMDTVLQATEAKRDDTDVSFGLEFSKARERRPDTRRDFDKATVALVNDEWMSSATVEAPRPPSPAAKKFYDALVDAFVSGPTTTFDRWKAVTLDQWRSVCERMGLLEKDRGNGARALFSKYKRELITCNLIACNDEAVWMMAQPTMRQ